MSFPPFVALSWQETTEEQATIFYRLSMEKKCMKAWRKYMQIMKSAVSYSLYIFY